MVDTQKAEIDHAGPTLPQGAREGFLEEVTLGEVLQDEKEFAKAQKFSLIGPGVGSITCGEGSVSASNRCPSFRLGGPGQENGNSSGASETVHCFPVTPSAKSFSVFQRQANQALFPLTSVT